MFIKKSISMAIVITCCAKPNAYLKQCFPLIFFNSALILLTVFTTYLCLRYLAQHTRYDVWIKAEPSLVWVNTNVLLCSTTEARRMNQTLHLHLFYTAHLRELTLIACTHSIFWYWTGLTFRMVDVACQTS